MREIGVAICSNTLITMHNGTKIYAEDDVTSIEQKMKEQGENIIITISAILEGISRSVKKSDIKEWRKI